jgi:hypothetical protein
MVGGESVKLRHSLGEHSEAHERAIPGPSRPRRLRILIAPKQDDTLRDGILTWQGRGVEASDGWLRYAISKPKAESEELSAISPDKDGGPA